MPDPSALAGETPSVTIGALLRTALQLLEEKNGHHQATIR